MASSGVSWCFCDHLGLACEGLTCYGKEYFSVEKPSHVISAESKRRRSVTDDDKKILCCLICKTRNAAGKSKVRNPKWTRFVKGNGHLCRTCYLPQTPKESTYEVTCEEGVYKLKKLSPEETACRIAARGPPKTRKKKKINSQ
jgi:hypothetical protein